MARFSCIDYDPGVLMLECPINVRARFWELTVHEWKSNQQNQMYNYARLEKGLSKT